MATTQPIRKRTALFTFVAVFALTALAIPFDHGRYAVEFRLRGLLGFLALPSVLVFQLGFLVGTCSLLVWTLRRTAWRGLRIVGLLAVLAVGVYCTSLYLIGEASRAGEFGIGAAGVVALFGFFPSAGFLLLVVPATLLYATYRPCA